MTYIVCNGKIGSAKLVQIDIMSTLRTVPGIPFIAM